jgi:hypothetical protein
MDSNQAKAAIRFGKRLLALGELSEPDFSNDQSCAGRKCRCKHAPVMLYPMTKEKFTDAKTNLCRHCGLSFLLRPRGYFYV